MKPEVWVPALATLLAALLAALTPVALHSRTKLKKTRGDGARETPAKSRSRRRRNGRALELFPAAAEFLKRRAPYSVGYQYDRDMLPDLVRVYTKNDLNSGGELPAQQQAEGVPGSATASSSGPVAEQPISFEKLLLDPKVKHMAITGEAGIGKTSLLEYWDHQLRHLAPCNEDPVTKYRPVLIAARMLVGQESVTSGLGKDSPDLLSEPPGRGLTWLVMIDAFDEITDAADRAEVERIVFEAIEEATGGETPCKFVITTRGLTDVRRRSFDSRGVSEYKLQPFTRDQLRQFLIREECRESDRELENAPFRMAVEKVDRFLRRWEGHDDLLELIRLPLLARVAATIYFQDSKLDIPARRVDVYHDAVEHWLNQCNKRLSSEMGSHGPALRLLQDWQAGIGGPESLDADRAVRDLLAELALRYLDTGQRSVVALGCEILGVPLRPKDPDRFEALQTLLETTGLVYDVRAIAPRFLHKSFAEYLAAPLQLDRYRTVDDWDAAIRDPETRISAVFAFAQLHAAVRRDLIAEFESDDRFLLVCGWLAAEGLCTDERTGDIDEACRNRLIDRCVAALPAHPTDEWWQLITGLSAVEYARDLLHQKVVEQPVSHWTLVRLARTIAKQDSRGVDLLRFFIIDPKFTDFLRLEAAQNLMEHEPEEAAEILERYASKDNPQDIIRMHALRRICEYDKKTGVPRLRALAVDPAVTAQIRVIAAVWLADYDEEHGLDLLRTYATASSIPQESRVSAAMRLADSDAEAEALLRRYAGDTAFPDFARVLAANALVNLDRGTGLAMLQGFTRDGNLDDAAQVHAAYRLVDHGQEGAIERIRAFATDFSIQTSARMTAARLLLIEHPRFAETILESIAGDTANTDVERVGAMDDLLEVDRQKWLPILLSYADDPCVDDDARPLALLHVANHDHELGLHRLRELGRVEWLSESAQVDTMTFRYSEGDPSALRDLQTLAADPLKSGNTRVAAAVRIAHVNSTARTLLLQLLAGDAAVDDNYRVWGFNSLILEGDDSQYGSLAAIAADPRSQGQSRVEAASLMLRHSRADGIALLRRLAFELDLPDRDRVEAARYLAHHEPEEGLDLLSRFATDVDHDDTARLSAVLELTRRDKKSGVRWLLDLAEDRSLQDSVRVSAANRLATLDATSAGIQLLRAFAAGETVDGRASFEAAEWLFEFDREGSLEALTSLATEGDCEPGIEVEAAWCLMRHGASDGMRLLHAYAKDQSCHPMRAVRAERRLASFEPESGRDRFTAFVADSSLSDFGRVEAADALVRFDRLAGMTALRRFAEGPHLSDAARTVAARELAQYDRKNGIELTRSLALDTTIEDGARVSAADDLAWRCRVEGLALLRDLTFDATVDGFARVNSARCLANYSKREGIEALRRLAAEREFSETVRCWARIALADRDIGVRGSLLRGQGRQEAVDYVTLRAEVDALIGLDVRAGYRAERYIRNIELGLVLVGPGRTPTQAERPDPRDQYRSE